MSIPDIAELVADATPVDWWGSLKGCDAALGAIKAFKMRANNEAMSGRHRGEIRRQWSAELERARAAEREVLDRKRVLADMNDGEGQAFNRALRRIVKQAVGEATYERFVAEANDEARRLVAVRSAPMSPGSVLSPRGGGAGMRVRRASPRSAEP